MSVRALVGNVEFLLKNTDRQNAHPPVVFPDISTTTSYTVSVWVKITNKIPIILHTYAGTDGTQIVTGHDGTNWYVSVRLGSVMESINYFRPIILDAWTFIGVGKSGFGINIYYGLQDPSDTTPWTHPVTIVPIPAILSTFTSAPFSYFQLNVGATYSVSCLKIWTGVSWGAPVLQDIAQTFEPKSFGAVEVMWSSTLRTPGDLSNNAHPYADRDWAHGHAYTSITPLNNLLYDNDPSYMANNTPCPTWVYPLTFVNIFIDPPGQTPIVPTTYKAPQFYFFQDRGSVTPDNGQLVPPGIVLYGSAFGGIDPGTPFSECWGLYKNEQGAEIADMSNPDYRFVPGDTAVVIPPGTTGAITVGNMYLWRFGGQFVWNPVTPQTEFNTAHLAYLLLYVTFIGYPTGKMHLPTEQMTGLFATNKGGRTVDVYNRGIEIRLPQPTIRTAFIGE